MHTRYEVGLWLESSRAVEFTAKSDISTPSPSTGQTVTPLSNVFSASTVTDAR